MAKDSDDPTNQNQIQNQSQDLMGLDLAGLDLDHIQLERDRPPSPVWRWLVGLALLGIGALVLWIPTTETYGAVGGGNSWLFFGLCGAGAGVGLFAGRWLIRWMQDSTNRWAERQRQDTNAEEPAKPPSAVQRWLTLLAAIGGAAAIVFAIPQAEVVAAGGGEGGYSLLWFVAAGGAVVVGLLLGRWLLMQQTSARERPPAPPLRLPGWFKWVTLAVLIAASLVVLFGMSFVDSNQAENLEFGLGAVAFGIAVFAAIWLARRFEESEKKIQQRQRRPGPPV